jgi:maltooligosyltrehalose trehalohydrolase
VREGRRREFARFASFSDEKRRAQIPDPNAPQTFAASSPRADSTDSAAHPDAHERLDWMHFYKSALTVRAKLITPRLAHVKALGATVLSKQNGDDANALVARWRLDDGETLSIALNLDTEAIALSPTPEGMVVFETPPRVRDHVREQILPSNAMVAWLTGDVCEYASTHDARKVVEREWHA